MALQDAAAKLDRLRMLAQLWLISVLLAAGEWGSDWLEARASDPEAPVAKVAQADTIITGVIVVIIGIVGIAVVVSVNATFDSPTNTGLSESQQSLLEGFGSMLDLDVAEFESPHALTPHGALMGLSSSLRGTGTVVGGINGGNNHYRRYAYPPIAVDAWSRRPRRVLMAY